ncbi:MAG: LamG-like jellyroll fold domain-containing protein [Chloroflexota bacterium]
MLPSGFQDNVVRTGLIEPTAIEFASDGRVFVAEKSGLIKLFTSLTDTTPSVFADLSTQTYNFWDRGMLGMALHPNFPAPAYVYVLYAHDAEIGGTAPKYGTPGDTTDPCPDGATTDGCVVSGRLSRLTASGDTWTGPELVLVEDWCQQYPSHSVGSLEFGQDGFLYASGGDGASFTFMDYGQDGNPRNPCGDPPAGVGGTMTLPTAEGGALRSQDLRTGSGTPTAYASVVASMSPTAYWRLGETSGTMADDSAGSHDGTYVGGVTLGASGLLVGDSNKAASFDGVNDYVSVPDSTALNPTTAVTVAAWIRPDAWGTGNRRIVQKHTADTQYMLRTTQSGSRLEFRIYGKNAAFTTTLPAIGQAHLVVGTYDGSRVKLYVDNVLVSSKTASGPIPVQAGVLVIGSKPGTVVAADHFDGVIDDVSIHGVALTASQITQLWQAGNQTQPGTDPVSLDGGILRVDPSTGAGAPGNPLISSTDPNARRLVAEGFRNPFRFTIRPGTNEVWAGDVGWNTWEEINRLVTPADATVDNFGWPCYEGSLRQSQYDSADLNLCENLYGDGASAVKAPYFAYRHSDQVVPGEGCQAGSSSIAGLAFYESGPYPLAYDDALFFADYSRDCIWVMQAGANGLPDPGEITTFVDGAANPVQLKVGPNGDLFYLDFDGGTIHRVTFSEGNQPPTAVAAANPTSGPVPLLVSFSGTGSSDPEGGTLTYDWDLDGDGDYDDSSSATPSWTYSTSQTVIVGLRVTDPGGAMDTGSVTITAGNSPPTAFIDTPADGSLWQVGEVISFSGHATDPNQAGNLPPSALSWSLDIQHCPSTCHAHPVQDFAGVASGSFTAPDHEYYSYLELTLTATDAQGLTDSDTIQLEPRTVALAFATNPSGLQLAVNGTSAAAPFTRTVIIGSTNTISATTPQSLGGTNYSWTSWSPPGAQTHDIIAPAQATTYTATYTIVPSGTSTFIPIADSYVSNMSGNTNYGTATSIKVREGTVAAPTTWRSYLKFDVTGITGPVTSVKLRLYVIDQSDDGGGVYAVGTGWTETGLTYNNAPVISGASLGSSGTTLAGTYVEISLGAGAISGNGTYAFAIRSASTNNAAYISRESGTNPPQLVVTYAP